MAVREPAVAGHFYPSDPKELTHMIEKMGETAAARINAKGIILPHAGYVYSGKVACATVGRIIPKKKLVILGPNHTGEGARFSMCAEGGWRTPLGTVNIDRRIAAKIQEKESAIKTDTDAHRREHSIEVELPFFQHFFGDFEFVPIACGPAREEEISAVANRIFEAISEIKDTVLCVASSDMSHYEPDALARKKDRSAIEAILALDENALLERVQRENISMCGNIPVAVLLTLCKLLKAHKAEVALYQTSADTSGDYSAVVGYLGAIIH